MRLNILVTGASGFIGRATVRRLGADKNISIRVATRLAIPDLPAAIEQVRCDLNPESSWQPGVSGIDTVIHLAARVHFRNNETMAELDEYRRVNVQGTINLARQAAAAGVKRFLLISSVKVFGQKGSYSESSPANPVDPYGVSKAEAEVGLKSIAEQTGMDFVIVRPPLVYGPGVKANFQLLTKAIASRIPLPLGAIHNQRSMVALDNLVDFIVACVSTPAATNQTLVVSDGEDLSTTELVRRLAHAMARSPILIHVPAAVLLAAGTALGRRSDVARLTETFQIDITKTKQLLDWSPPISVNEGLRRCVQG